MSRRFDVKSLPMHRRLALSGSATLIFGLYLPWQNVTGPADVEARLDSLGRGLSGNGWEGAGAWAGRAAIVLILTELLLILRPNLKRKTHFEVFALILVGVAGLLAASHAVRGIATGGRSFGYEASPAIGSFVLIVAAALFAATLYVAAKVIFADGPGLLGPVEASTPTDVDSTPHDSTLAEPSCSPDLNEGNANCSGQRDSSFDKRRRVEGSGDE